jgi:hypothetical protein
MAIKRKSGSEPIVSGAAAPARGKSKVTRKHQSASAETSENPIATSAVIEPPAVPAESSITPTFEEIAQLAYCYWEARGYQGGSPEHDWLRAESELRCATLARS